MLDWEGGCGGKGDYMCEGIESHCVECVYFPGPKQVLKDILGQLRKLWALPCDELLYLDSQEGRTVACTCVVCVACTCVVRVACTCVVWDRHQLAGSKALLSRYFVVQKS